MKIQRLPDEIIDKIFLYLQSPDATIIKKELKIYATDHNDHYTKIAGYYYVKNIISFSDYYFDKVREPFEYESCQTKYIEYE